MAFPATEATLLLFVSKLYQDGLAPGTIKSYLAAVRFGSIRRGLGNPQLHLMPQLEYALKGVKRLSTKGCRKRLPITPDILRKLKAVWQRDPKARDCKMLWAASCLCFFAFLRSGEVVSPSTRCYDATTHLCFEDVRVNDRQFPSALQVTVKASKTDPFRQGVVLHVGASGDSLCPVAAVLDYMVARGGKAGPLFMWKDGRFLTREDFVAGLRVALKTAGLAADDYAGHSFRIGAATTAAQCGLQDALIKTLGRWESSAYTRYIRTSADTLRNVARTLSHGGVGVGR